MKTPENKNFKKSKNCPATCLLLLCSTAELPENESRKIFRHIQRCDFCAAELQLLTAHAPCDAEVDIPEMPLQLRQLAETLLSGKQVEFKILDSLYANQETPSLNQTWLWV